jgi:hypothetical protein
VSDRFFAVLATTLSFLVRFRPVKYGIEALDILYTLVKGWSVRFPFLVWSMVRSNLGQTWSTLVKLGRTWSKLSKLLEMCPGLYFKGFWARWVLVGTGRLGSGCLVLRADTRENPVGKNVVMTQFSTKIQTENMFFGKTNLRGLLRQNSAKFSSGTILPPNSPYSQLDLEKRYGAGFIKKIPTENVFFRMDETSLRDTFAPNRAI